MLGLFFSRSRGDSGNRKKKPRAKPDKARGPYFRRLRCEPLEYRRMLTTPAITGLNPAYPVATGSAQAFTINGSNFQSGCTVTLVDGGGVGTTFTNMPISSQSPTQIVINPNFGTGQDVWGVEVINPGPTTSNEYFFATTPTGQSQSNRFGVDYSFGRPTMSSLQAAGSNFVVRYVSPAPNNKNITLSEAQSLLAAGQDIILVFESTANEMLNGYNAGVTDANTAVSEAIAAGAPSNFFCYFAADFDATLANQTPINAYLNGAASVLGLSRVGLYGGYYPVSRALTAGAASKGWQTVAWSGGQVYSGISLYQYANTILSNTSDVDMGIGGNMGQWTPAGLTASATGIQTVSISWSTASVATGYTLDRATSSAGPWTQVYSGSSASFADSGLQFGTTYYYQVCFDNGSGRSSFSSSVSATTLSGVPTGLTATATGSQSISVSWSTVTGATTYTLQRATSSSGPWTQVYSGSTASYSNSGLQPGTTYYYEVKSGTTTGSSAYSSSVSKITYPATPTGLTASATGPQSISTSWSTMTGATTYALQRATSSNGPWTQVYSGSTASYSNTVLQPGTTYIYEVRSGNGSGNSAYSSPVSATTTPTVVVTSPTNGQVVTSYPITVSGSASDTGGTGLTEVTVINTANSSTGSETLSGTSASYAVSGIVLVAGQNVIDVESFDNGGYHSSVAVVTVTYSPATWTGGGTNTNWSTAANWGGTAPAAESDLVFDGSTGLTTTNDLAAGTQFGNLTFNAGAGAFILNGNSVNFSGVITNNSTNAETIDLSLGGAYALTKNGSGTVVLSAANSFTGGTVVTGGTLKFTTPTALLDGSNLSIGANALAAFGAVVAAPTVNSPASETAVSAAAVATSAALRTARTPSINDTAVPAALVNHLARAVARSETWADMPNVDGQQEENKLALRVWDAVLAEYGRA